tara:strand:- start:1181 stop:1366 length:186 start_codon:yes stop_codon:yes gene_type:complete
MTKPSDIKEFLFHVTLPSGATELHGAFGSSQENAYKKLAERFLDAEIVPYTKQNRMTKPLP